LAEGCEKFDEALAVNRQAGVKAGEGDSLLGLGLCRQHRGDLEGAKTQFGKAVAIARETGNPSGEASGLALLGDALRLQGQSSQAQASVLGALRPGLEIDSAR